MPGDTSFVPSFLAEENICEAVVFVRMLFFCSQLGSEKVGRQDYG